MSAISRLEPECADGFTADLEAVVAALLSYRRPIANVEGWITKRMANAFRDGYRARRASEMGAQQRVRVPARLAARLGNTPRPVALAVRILQWVGVRQAAGATLWPLGTWAQDRVALDDSADASVAEETVAAEVDAVLVVMKQWDAQWYERYVERPLGRKWAPVVFALPTADQCAPTAGGLAHLELVPRHEREDVRRTEAAAASLAMIRRDLAAGDEPRQVVARALAASYLSVGSVCDDIDRVPHSGVDPGEVVSAVLANPQALDRVVAAALEIVKPTRAGRQGAPCLGDTVAEAARPRQGVASPPALDKAQDARHAAALELPLAHGRRLVGRAS